MKSSFLRLVLPLAALAFVAPGSALAQKGKGGETAPASGQIVIPGGSHAETYVISQPGSYVLGGNRTMTDSTKPAIEIAAPDVTLDLGGFTIAFPGGATGTGRGVFIPQVENVEVRNGSILNAPRQGVSASSGKALRLIDLRIGGSGNEGMWTEVQDTLVDRCHVWDTGASGILVVGGNAIIRQCVVSNAAGTGIFAGNYTQVSGSVVRLCGEGVRLNANGTLVDCSINNNWSFGVLAGHGSSVRNNNLGYNAGRGVVVTGAYVEIVGNLISGTYDLNGVRVGIVAFGGSTVIASNRILNNGTSVEGAFVNGGGNSFL